MKYLAITTIHGDQFIIRVTRENNRGVVGIEVDRDGEEVSGRDFDVRERIVPAGAIKRATEMRMNMVYGRLERAK